MKNSNLLIIGLLALLIIQAPTSVLGQKTSEVIGQVSSAVALQKFGEKFKIQYEDNNENSTNTTSSVIIEDKTTLDKLYGFLMDGFESMNPGPLQFQLSEGELRIYYIQRIGKDQVEIIHEDKATEQTGTMQRLTRTEIQKLFGKDY